MRVQERLPRRPGVPSTDAIVFDGRPLAPGGADPHETVTSLLRRVGFRHWHGALNRVRGRQRAVIVMYHSFTPGGWAAIAPATLRWHLELLRERSRVVPLSRLVAAVANHERTDDQVALTVDDAYEDFFTVAYPMLCELGLPATLFVPTGFIGAHNDWGEKPPQRRIRVVSGRTLRELDPSLITLGSHSVHHRALTGIPAETVEMEIRRSKSDLESLINVPVTLFSYPFGGHGTYARATISALRAAGFVAAVTATWGTYGSDRELMSLSRISFRDSDGPAEVIAKLAGDFDWMRGRELASHFVRSTLGVTR